MHKTLYSVWNNLCLCVSNHLQLTRLLPFSLTLFPSHQQIHTYVCNFSNVPASAASKNLQHKKHTCTDKRRYKNHFVMTRQPLADCNLRLRLSRQANRTKHWFWRCLSTESMYVFAIYFNTIHSFGSFHHLIY